MTMKHASTTGNVSNSKLNSSMSFSSPESSPLPNEPSSAVKSCSPINFVLFPMSTTSVDVKKRLTDTQFAASWCCLRFLRLNADPIVIKSLRASCSPKHEVARSFSMQIVLFWVHPMLFPEEMTVMSPRCLAVKRNHYKLNENNLKKFREKGNTEWKMCVFLTLQLVRLHEISLLRRMLSCNSSSVIYKSSSTRLNWSVRACVRRLSVTDTK